MIAACRTDVARGRDGVRDGVIGDIIIFLSYIHYTPMFSGGLQLTSVCYHHLESRFRIAPLTVALTCSAPIHQEPQIKVG